MPNIESVDYNVLQQKAGQIREEGRTLMSNMRDAYTKIGGMSSAWYGKRYNMLVDAFNEMIPLLNQISRLTMADFPNALDTIAVNYARADMDEGFSPRQSDEVTTIAEIAHSQAVGLRFVSSEVENIHDEIVLCFSNANSQLASIEGICNSLPWSSDAQDAFIKTFDSLKNQIQQSFETTINSFKTLIQQVNEDMNDKEQANTIGGIDTVGPVQ